MSPACGAPGRPAAAAAQFQGSSADTTAARLLIHTGRSGRPRRSAEMKALWQRWIDRTPRVPALSDANGMRVEVAAENGRHWFALSALQGTVEMTIGPGTYDITVVTGGIKRRYTLTLDPGTTLDLDLELHDRMQGD